MSIFAGAVLPRIRFMMPSCSFCSYRDSWMSSHHCTCGYIPDVYRIADLGDITGLFAPKPVVIVAGEKDDIQPIKGVRDAYRDLQRIYRAAGAEDRCPLVVGKEGHRFYADEAWPVLMKELRRT